MTAGYSTIGREVDDYLLSEELKSLAQKNGVPVEIQVLKMMTEIIVTEVTESGKIRFTKGGMNYETCRAGPSMSK